MKVALTTYSNHCTNIDFHTWRLGNLRRASRLGAPRRFRAPRASGASAPRPTLTPTNPAGFSQRSASDGRSRPTRTRRHRCLLAGPEPARCLAVLGAAAAAAAARAAEPAVPPTARCRLPSAGWPFSRPPPLSRLWSERPKVLRAAPPRQATPSA